MEKFIVIAIVLFLILIVFFTMRSSDLMICKNNKDLEKAYGKNCFVVGNYEVQEFYTKKNTVLANWPVLVLEDSTVVLLESFWNAIEKRSPKEKSELVGKKVKAKGLLHREPPKDKAAQNIAIPCLTEVEESLIE